MSNRLLAGSKLHYIFQLFIVITSFFLFTGSIHASTYGFKKIDDLGVEIVKEGEVLKAIVTNYSDEDLWTDVKPEIHVYIDYMDVPTLVFSLYDAFDQRAYTAGESSEFILKSRNASSVKRVKVFLDPSREVADSDRTNNVAILGF